MTPHPVITVTRSPNRPTLAYILFPAGLLHEEVTRADVTLTDDGLLVSFRDGGEYQVKERRLTLPPAVAPNFKVGRHPVGWSKMSPTKILMEFQS